MAHEFLLFRKNRIDFRALGALAPRLTSAIGEERRSRAHVLYFASLERPEFLKNIQLRFYDMEGKPCLHTALSTPLYVAVDSCWL